MIDVGQVAIDTCGNAGVAPHIASTNWRHPQALDLAGNPPPNWNPADGRYTIGGVNYVSGNGVRIEIATDGCTNIQSVKMGSTVVTPTYNGGYWYSVLDETNTPSSHVMSLWIFFPTSGDGTTDDVTITVGRTGGSGTATYSFPLVRVKNVQAIATDANIGTSGAEMFNMFAASLYNQFNGATNSVVVNGRRLYGYDPNSLGVRIDATGIWFTFKFKADVADWCDPTATVTGTFTFDADPVHGLTTRWVNGVHANLDWGWCGDLVDIPLLGVIADIAYIAVGDAGAGASVQKTLTDQINASVPNLGTGQLFLDGTWTTTELLNVRMKLPFPSVEIAVPYDAYDMGRSGTRLPPGQPVILLASGLGMNDAVARVSPATSLSSGPNGVPRDATTLLANERKVARSGSLVDDGADVARLLARTSIPRLGTTTTSRYSAGCQLTAPGGGRFGFGATPEIRFGVNDTAADAQRLRGMSAPGYSVRMLFGSGGDPCVGTTTGGVVSNQGGLTSK